MDVYFTASIVGKKLYLPNYLRIVEILKQKKIRVVSDHIINSSEEQINLQSKSNRVSFHKKLKKWIMDCSCMIAEGSFPSISVGFEISLALNTGKPVLLLYTKEAPSLLSSYDDEKLICSRYTDMDLKDTIDEFMNYVRGNSNQRFTFFINAKIARYLEEVSRKKQVPKSVYIRGLIEKEIGR